MRTFGQSTSVNWKRPSRAVTLFGGSAGKNVFRRFFGGGDAGTDTVPAMLTPGDWVISKPAVQRYGANMMHAINEMLVPREARAHARAASAIRDGRSGRLR